MAEVRQFSIIGSTGVRDEKLVSIVPEYGRRESERYNDGEEKESRTKDDGWMVSRWFRRVRPGLRQDRSRKVGHSVPSKIRRPFMAADRSHAGARSLTRWSWRPQSVPNFR